MSDKFNPSLEDENLFSTSRIIIFTFLALVVFLIGNSNIKICL